MGLLSPTQVACQAGVQPGDVVQLLQAIDACTSTSQDTLYMLKRDHVQGFDRLDPQRSRTPYRTLASTRVSSNSRGPASVTARCA